MLYRVFPFDPVAAPGALGDPLYVARSDQGRGRHDAPGAYGALYLSRESSSATAEFLLRFRGREVTPVHLTWGGDRRYSIAAFDEARLGPLVDLDDPRELVRRRLRPSLVATRDRVVTQGYAVRLYEEGLRGFEWWSTLEASWKNVTLFSDRAAGQLRLTGDPDPLRLDHPAVIEAAEAIGVTLAA